MWKKCEVENNWLLLGCLFSVALTAHNNDNWQCWRWWGHLTKKKNVFEISFRDRLQSLLRILTTSRFLNSHNSFLFICHILVWHMTFVSILIFETNFQEKCASHIKAKINYPIKNYSCTHINKHSHDCLNCFLQFLSIIFRNTSDNAIKLLRKSFIKSFRNKNVCNHIKMFFVRWVMKWNDHMSSKKKELKCNNLK